MGNKKHGFTLLEILIVISILGVLAASGIASYDSFFRTADIELTSKSVASNLSLMEARALADQGDVNWGAHFVNGTPDDYYELFSTPTTYSDSGKAIVEKDYLPKTMLFTDPSPGNTKDIIFNKVTGTTTPATITMVTTSGVTKTINVTSLGTVY